MPRSRNRTLMNEVSEPFKANPYWLQYQMDSRITFKEDVLNLCFNPCVSLSLFDVVVINTIPAKKFAAGAKRIVYWSEKLLRHPYVKSC